MILEFHGKGIFNKSKTKTKFAAILGPGKQREVEVKIINFEGKEMWSRVLTQEGLK